VITTETKKITASTAGFCDIVDLTAKFKDYVQRAKFRAGTATLFVSGSTAALTTIEHEPGLVQDLKEFVEKLIPSDRRYHHDDRWGDNNGFAHLRAALFGPSLVIPIVDGAPSLGTWQQIILIDFDNRPRTREIIVQLIGEIE
jgi:secondary thiamine-phosphate synthase enzyme